MTDRPIEPPLWEQMAQRSAELPQGERLQKVLASTGYGSRRVCEDLIAAGRVTVNGDVAILGRRVDVDNDLVEVDGAPIGVRPDFVYYLMPPEALAKFQEMYNPGNRRHGMRDADDNVAMFGFYIWNNVKIGFQTFAGGIAFGLGSIFYLVSNGVLIGATAGYITQVGYGTPFWSFVSGHSAMELVAIVISGAAGLRLGGALVAPGQRSRKAALVAAAQPAVRLMYGAAGMFLIAAFIEAFWSPLTAFPPVTKYAVGAILWGVVLGYFLFGGRGRAA